jgi:hypothetical protein
MLTMNSVTQRANGATGAVGVVSSVLTMHSVTLMTSQVHGTRADRKAQVQPWV